MLFVVQFEDVNTDSLLDAVRGAGMSQRTRRPYLQRSVSRCSWNAAPCALRWCDWERGTNLERQRYESKVARSVADEAPSRSCMCALTIDGRGAMCDVRCGAMEDGDVPFEFICEIARARALAEASHVEGGAAAARHVDGGGVGEKGGVMAVGCVGVVVEVGGGGGGVGRERVEWQTEGRIKTEVEGRKELLACCKRNRFQSLSRVKSRAQSLLLHCSEKFVLTRISTRKHRIALLFSQLEPSPSRHSNTNTAHATGALLCSKRL